MKCVLVIILLLCLPFIMDTQAQLIYLPARPSAEEQKAALELQEHLRLVMGKPVHVSKEPSTDSGTQSHHRLFVGNTSFAQKHGLQASEFPAETWRLKSVGRDLILLGGAPRGTLYAVFEYLERCFGILWLDETTTVLPPATAWPCNMDLKGRPAFPVRGLYAYFRHPASPRQTYMIRNRQNLFHDERATKFFKDYAISPIFGAPRACHTYYDYTKDWGPEHETCFSLTADGKRLKATSPSGPGQICFTNPQTVDLFVAKLRKYIRADRQNTGQDPAPVIYDISANDNQSPCSCKSCLAAAETYGSYGGVVLAFTNAIARRIATDYPDISVQMFAYGFAEKAPHGIRAEPNVLVRIAQLGTEFSGIRDSLRPLSHPNNAESLRRMHAWANIAPLAIWDYWILYGHHPSVTGCHQTISENLRLYQKLKIRSFFAEAESPLTTSFYPLRLWLGLRLMNNPQANLQHEILRFMKGYYGKSYDVMLELLNYIETRNEEISEPYSDVPLRFRTDLDDKFFSHAYELLAKAFAKANDRRVTNHIRKERCQIGYVHLSRLPELSPMDPTPLYRQVRNDMAELGPAWLTPQRLNKLIKTLDYLFLGLSLKIQLPKELAKRHVVHDLTWPKLHEDSTAKLRDVSNAYGGKAIALPISRLDKGTLSFGFYDVTNRKFVRSINIPREKIPQDEAFHLYSVGRVTLPPKSMIWIHDSWRINRNLNEYHETNGRSNDYEIFLSIKVQGTQFVKDSTSQGTIMLDRILLVR